MVIYADHAVFNGERITLYEAACILSRSMQPIYKALTEEDGYIHYDVAMAAKYNAIDSFIDGEEEED
jgi:hypothetical protein